MTKVEPSSKFHSLAGTARVPQHAYIDGEFSPARSGETFENLNPGIAAALGRVTACDSADVDRAVKAARRVFDEGTRSRAAPEHRKAVLLRLVDLVRKNAEELATLECLDSGKTISDRLNEIGHEVPTFFQWYAELIDKSFGKVAPTADSDPEEALHIATDTEYGLHATVFTRDIDRAIDFGRRIPCGTVSINKFSEGDVKTPFGGYRRSGSLARDNGTEAMDQYQQTKTIWISTTA